MQPTRPGVATGSVSKLARHTLLLLILAVFSLPSPLLDREAAAQHSLTDLHTLIRPSEDEQAWLRIPWMTDLWEARRAATESGKPIFLWEMDGNPLGCT